MELLSAKIIASLLLGAISLFLGIVPVILKRFKVIGQNSNSKNGKFILAALSCFGGGVILATCFTHMLPEVNVAMRRSIQKGNFPDSGLAMSEILVLCGFFMIYIVEEVTHVMVDKLHRGMKRRVTDVNGQIPEIKDGEEDESKPMYQDPTSIGHHGSNGNQNHVHEEAPVDLLTMTESENQFQAALRGFLVILALSLHAVFEGIGLGLAQTSKSAWFLFFAISCHKYVISFCIGMQFINSGLKPLLICGYVSTFALISPVGAIIGITISETVPDEASLHNSAVIVLQALACGTLLYVVFFEIIEKERQKGTNGFLQVTFLVAGFMAMILMEWIGIKTVGPDAHSVMNTSSELRICTLNNFQPEWTLPMNFTCNKNITDLNPLINGT